MKKNLFIAFCLFCLSNSLNLNAQIINTLTGNGTPGYVSDGVAASGAEINSPYDVAVDRWGTVYIADYGNFRIRKIDTFGIITTIAGTGISGFSGNGGPATAAKILGPRSITVDKSGVVYFSDFAKNCVRKIGLDGIIYPVAGRGDTIAGFYGDNGPATAAMFNGPWGIAVDKKGNVFIADASNNRIRKVDTFGIVTTVVGDGVPYPINDGMPATAGRVQYPYGIDIDNLGNLYIADNGNNIIRKVDTLGIIHTIGGVPGTGSYGYTGDNGPATAAKIYSPYDVAVDSNRNVYIADWHNDVIRRINANGTMITVVGNGLTGFSGDNGNALMAKINYPTGVCIGGKGFLYFADFNNNRVRYLGENVYVNPLFAAKMGIAVSPNPTSNKSFSINISTPMETNAHVLISTITGKQIKDFTIATNKPTIINLYEPAGIYIITAAINEDVVSEKVIIGE